MPTFAIHRDAETADFLDGSARGEFLIVRDTETGAALGPQFDISIDPERYRYEAASGEATIVSWSVVHQRTADGVTRTVVGIVELREGPWWWTEIAGVDPDSDLLGAAARVDFANPGADSDAAAEAVPYFRASP